MEHIGVTIGTFKPGGALAVNVGAIRNGGASAMCTIPLELQRRFEQRWAARFGSLVVPAAPKNVGLKRLTINIAPPAAKAREKPAGLSRRVVCLCDMKANPPA
jgi:hypothetical protein